MHLLFITKVSTYVCKSILRISSSRLFISNNSLWCSCALPHYSHDLLLRTILDLVFSRMVTEAQGKARPCSGSPEKFMAQPGLRPGAPHTQPRSACDLGQPPNLLFLCCQKAQQRMLLWHQDRPARFSCCQPLGKPSGRRRPVLWPHGLLGIPGPWPAAKGENRAAASWATFCPLLLVCISLLGLQHA